ncbi:hypothetical protein C8J56DRAFT_1025276 [Mycena floridula]|nr:hypothetical protein C8J56DRAFT_1025276 [Mycena floridula]
MASYNEAAIKSLQLWHITNYGYVAAEVLVVMDILLTLDLEVHLVWPQRASPGKILFLLLYEFYAFESILALKTYALYQTRWSIYLLWFGVVVPSLMVTITIIYMYCNAINWNHLLPGTGCVPDCTGKICTFDVVIYLVQFAGFDTMVVWLTAWRAYTVYRARREIVRDSLVDQMYPYSGFLGLFFRDGLIYYSCILIIAVLNILATLIAPGELLLFSTKMTQALSTITCFSHRLDITKEVTPLAYFRRVLAISKRLKKARPALVSLSLEFGQNTRLEKGSSNARQGYPRLVEAFKGMQGLENCARLR